MPGVSLKRVEIGTDTGGLPMNIRSEQGIAAIGVVVMLLVVLSLLATALWQYSMFQIRIAARNDAYAQALYLAHAGAGGSQGCLD